jgi:hypothetical protein
MTLQSTRLHNRPVVSPALVENVNRQAKDHRAAPQQTRPVHGAEGDGDCCWKEGEDHDEHGPQDSEGVGRDAEAAETERAVGDGGGPGDAVVEQQADRQHVGAEEAGDNERSHGVEGCRGADVDQAEEEGDEGGEGEGVEG